MKAKIVAILAAAAVVAALVFSYLQTSKERDKEAAGEKPVTAESKVERAANGQTVVNLDPGAQKLIGLETTPLKAATLAPEIMGYGRVLDPAQLLNLSSGVASARAALEASNKEYQRMKALFTQGENASVRAVETAEAVMTRDQIALKTAEAQLVSGWGKAIVEQPDLPGFVRALASLDTVLVRIDLPAGELAKEMPKGARLVLPGAKQVVEAQLLGRTTTTDLQIQGEGFLCLATNASGRLSPGLAITGFLQLPGEPLRGVVVPEAAVVRTAERAWAYVQTGDASFTRREINLARPVADGWFATTGASPNDRIVTVGAQTLLSEERKSEIKIGD
jgi:hypothetical protein